MNWIGSLFWILPRRLRSSWALLAITAFGVLAAVTLMSLGAIYTRALSEAGLRHSVASSRPEILNTHIIAQNRPLGPADYANLRSNLEEIVQDRVGFMTRDIQRYGRPQPEILLVDEPFDPSQLLGAPSARPFFLTDFQEHARLIDGRWPSPEPGENNGRLSIEVAVGQVTATVMFWELGSEGVILPYRSDLDQQIHVKVVGLVEPIDTEDVYWMGYHDYFGPQEAGEIVLMPLYVPEPVFFNGIGARYPTLVGDFGWYLYLDTDLLDADLVQPLRHAFQSMETDINKRVPRSLILTRLENSRDTGLLAQYQRALTRARAPIYLFISMVVVVILYFLALVTGLLAKTRSEEAGLLRSRGASMLQVGGVITLAEALLVIIATLVGPFLAYLIFRLVLFGTIDPKGGTEVLEIGPPGRYVPHGRAGRPDEPGRPPGRQFQPDPAGPAGLPERTGQAAHHALPAALLCRCAGSHRPGCRLVAGGTAGQFPAKDIDHRRRPIGRQPAGGPIPGPVDRRLPGAAGAPHPGANPGLAGPPAGAGLGGLCPGPGGPGPPCPSVP